MSKNRFTELFTYNFHTKKVILEQLDNNILTYADIYNKSLNVLKKSIYVFKQRPNNKIGVLDTIFCDQLYQLITFLSGKFSYDNNKLITSIDLFYNIFTKYTGRTFMEIMSYNFSPSKKNLKNTIIQILTKNQTNKNSLNVATNLKEKTIEQLKKEYSNIYNTINEYIKGNISVLDQNFFQEFLNFLETNQNIIVPLNIGGNYTHAISYFSIEIFRDLLRPKNIRSIYDFLKKVNISISTTRTTLRNDVLYFFNDQSIKNRQEQIKMWHESGIKNKNNTEETKPTEQPSPSVNKNQETVTQKYYPVTTFPFGFGSMNIGIQRIQNIIGAKADGKFGPDTLNKLKNYISSKQLKTPFDEKTGITKELYSEIIRSETNTQPITKMISRQPKPNVKITHKQDTDPSGYINRNKL